jgi:hypothetical protein
MSAAKPSNQNRSISVGGSVHGSTFIQGDSNTVSVQYQQATLPEPENVDIQSELQALREILSKFNNPVLEGVTKVIDGEANKANPNKSIIGSTLETGLTYAKNLEGFAEAIDKLRPHVEKSAAWLGENWYKILPLVGLAI